MSVRNITWIEKWENENRIEESNLLLDIPSNHVLNKDLNTTSVNFYHTNHIHLTRWFYPMAIRKVKIKAVIDSFLQS